MKNRAMALRKDANRYLAEDCDLSHKVFPIATCLVSDALSVDLDVLLNVVLLFDRYISP